MENWKTYKLEEIATVQTGPFGSQLHQKDYVNNGTPIITVEHLGENRIFHENLPRVSNEDKERLIKYSIQTNDIVFSRVGSVDRRALVRKKENGWLFSGRCLRVRVKSENVNSTFLSFYFGQESFKE
jgi:type I restriction enzyme, S subunit